MANKTLFASLRGELIPQTDTRNAENAPAYALAPKHALAQYAATGCFGRTFYATAEEQLTRVLELCEAIDSKFIARVANGSRKALANVVATVERSAANAGGTTFNLEVPGSSPGRAFAAR